MAERDDEVAARYRALATEEPSVVLDDAIRAAARRSVGAAPGGSRLPRWAMPASVAAVLVLSFGVVLRMQQEQPGVESPLPAREAPASEAPTAKPDAAPAPSTASAPPAAQPAQKPDPRAANVPAAEPPAPAPREKKATAGLAAPESTQVMPAAPPAPAPVPFPAAAEARRDAPVAREEAAGSLARERGPAPAITTQTAPAPARAKTEAAATAAPVQDSVGKAAAAETPEKKLERIAELRRAARHREADEALEKFRREHADYKIAPEMWERVRPR